MSNIYQPYDAYRRLGSACSLCGRAHEADRPDLHAGVTSTEAADGAAINAERLSDDFVEAALVKALFPQDGLRRRFLQAVGVNTARAAIASVLPIGAMQAIAQDKPGSLEKRELKIGFIPITCATPLIMADPLGFYKRQGLSVSLNKTAGWALVRDRMINSRVQGLAITLAQ